MEAKKEESTRGQELYFRHLSLFSKAVPLTVKAYIKEHVRKNGQSLDYILTEKKEHIQTFYKNLYTKLFVDNDENIDEQIETWGIKTLCEVVFVLSEHPEIDSVKCISDQHHDLENYAKSAFLDFDTFQYKWNGLTSSLRRLFTDTDADFECTRLIHSFDESTDIHVSRDVCESLKRTDDVNRHIQIATESVSTSNWKSEIGTGDISKFKGVLNNTDKENHTVQFVIQLSSRVVHTGESVTLVCELNKDDCQVVWSKDGEILTDKKSVNILAEKGRHFLIVPCTKIEDSGIYICKYNDLFSSASVLVEEEELHICTPLHTDCDGDINEYMKVSLRCTINICGKIPRWFHNNQEIKNDGKVSIVSECHTYKLIIHHVESADEGEYMVVFDRVTSKTSITVKGHMDHIVKQQMKEEMHNNWIRGVLALKPLQLGLELPAEKAVNSHHKHILKALPKTVSKQVCLECNSENLLPLHSKKQCPRTQNKHRCICSSHPHSRRVCPSNELCSEIYDLIVRDHRFEDPALTNTSMDKWKTDSWSIAACYISNTAFIHTSEYKRKQSAKDLDCAELLCLFVNNKAYLPNTNYGVFDMARRHRNELLHSASYEISDDKLREYLSDFRDVLEVRNNSNEKVFKHAEVEKSLKALDDLKNCEIYINTKEEIEKMKKDVRATALQEVTELLEAALSQKDEEFRQAHEELKDVESETGIKTCETHDGTECTWYCTDHNIFFCKSCMEKNHRSCSRLVKLRKRIPNKELKFISIPFRHSIKLKGNVISICTLPNGEFLTQLETKSGSEFLKLNKNFNPISNSASTLVDISSICYIGNNKAVFIQEINSSVLQFMNVISLQILQQEVNCKHNVHCLACHGDMIYAFDGRFVLHCTTDGGKAGTLCTLQDYKDRGNCDLSSLAVSADGEFIFCINRHFYMYKLDSCNGKVLLEINLRRLPVPQEPTGRLRILASLTSAVERDIIGETSLVPPVNVCYLENDTAILYDKEGHVLFVNSKGEYLVTKKDDMKRSSTVSYISTLYDRTASSLLVVDNDTLKLFTVKWDNDS
ncbi:uncharacterized protein LOC132723913 [Ruditapes philippinarum]|uniref:uncharacterized protein LOC132723913 n=1 Tax=Ruditapes philippinarum TaxID=129788 RepID=UPI00295A8B00|nr:uncharacterized protein LOC132723913 [Ruditapes philippinarum]